MRCARSRKTGERPAHCFRADRASDLELGAAILSAQKIFAAALLETMRNARHACAGACRALRAGTAAQERSTARSPDGLSECRHVQRAFLDPASLVGTLHWFRVELRLNLELAAHAGELAGAAGEYGLAPRR